MSLCDPGARTPPPSLYPGPIAGGRVGEETRVSCFWWAEGVAIGEGLPSSFPAGTSPLGGGQDAVKLIGWDGLARSTAGKGVATRTPV